MGGIATNWIPLSALAGVAKITGAIANTAMPNANIDTLARFIFGPPNIYSHIRPIYIFAIGRLRREGVFNCHDSLSMAFRQT